MRIRRRHIRRRNIILVAVLTLLVSSVYYAYISHDQLEVAPSSERKAVIVDQLSLALPNQTFAEAARQTLERRNYSVDYFTSENVTVNFYRNLPTLGYKIIILRAHSALGLNRTRPLALFTSEPYITAKYAYEQLTNQLVCVVSAAEDSGSKSYFGILSDFIRNSMKGRFPKSIIFLMGCDGLTYTDMARAFIDRGAEVCLGWYGPVQLSHTDLATERVLESFVSGEKTLKEAIEKMLKEIGPDPVSGGLLVWYPSEAGGKKDTFLYQVSEDT